MSTIRLKIIYEWSGLEELCLPQRDKVMAALLATGGPENIPEIWIDTKLISTEYEGPDRLPDDYGNPDR